MCLIDGYKASLMIDIQGWLICLIHRGDHEVGPMLGGKEAAILNDLITPSLPSSLGDQSQVGKFPGGLPGKGGHQQAANSLFLILNK